MLARLQKYLPLHLLPHKAYVKWAELHLSLHWHSYSTSTHMVQLHMQLKTFHILYIDEIF